LKEAIWKEVVAATVVTVKRAAVEDIGDPPKMRDLRNL